MIDLADARAMAHLRVGASPRGIAMAPDGAHAFVNNTLDGTLIVIDTALDTVVKTIAITDIPLAPVILLGKSLFNSALEPRLSTDNWISCAVCNFDDMTDARTWAGFPDGPRNTPSLLRVVDTLPVHWSDDLDELADVELTIRNIQAGAGLTQGDTLDSLGPPHAGLSADLDALAACMASLEPLPSPYPSDTPEVASGEEVFQLLGCQACHAPPSFTDGQLHDVGTGDPGLERNSHGRGTAFDTPMLRGSGSPHPTSTTARHPRSPTFSAPAQTTMSWPRFRLASWTTSSPICSRCQARGRRARARAPIVGGPTARRGHGL